MALNDGTEDSGARELGIVTTVYLAAAGPIVAVGGASARNHPDVRGYSALRIVSWIGYGLTILDAAFLIGISFESEVANAHILSVGMLGAFSAVGFAIDAHAGANEADALRAAAPPSAQPRLTLSPSLGFARVDDFSERRVPLLGVRGAF
jgi:hypothetical protein